MPILTWSDRDSAVKAAEVVPYRVLEFDPNLSAGDPGAENLILQGDNLDATKAIMPYFAGRVKCFAIDPPYNTGSAFEQYDDNVEHSTWLSMMYPRLELMRDLLAEDGSIWVCIDDNEAHYLKVIMDEVFGRRNFLTNFVWQKSYGGGSKAKWFVGLHEHVICYAKNLERFPEMWLPPDPKAAGKYYKYTDGRVAERGPYRLQPLATTSMDERPNLRYPIPLPDGREVWPEKQWQWSRDRVLAALSNDEIVFTEKGRKITVSYKQYLRGEDGEERRRKPASIIGGNYTQHGTYESMALFGLKDKFTFPKPEGLIAHILEAATNPGDIVCDPFLGSGTTAAVAHKMGRRYIGIEMGDHAVTHCVPRLKKVIEGEQGGISTLVNWQGGGGFRFARLGPPMFTPDGAIHPDIGFSTLAAHIWFSDTHTAWSGERHACPERGRRTAASDSPLLGVHNGTAYYLLFNGILGDKRPLAGNVLNAVTFRYLPSHSGPKIVYGEACQWGPDRLRRENIEFRKIPHGLKVR